MKWFVPFYRRSGEISAYEHLEHRFGPWARTYAVMCYLLTQLGRMGTIMYLLALALQPMIGWSIPTLIMLTGIDRHRLHTDRRHGGGDLDGRGAKHRVHRGRAGVCGGVVVGHAPGTGAALRDRAESRTNSAWEFRLNFAQATFWVVLVYGMFINLQNFGIDQSYVQRYSTAVNEREAAKSVWLGALLYVPISGVFFLIGTLPVRLLHGASRTAARR